MAKKEINKKTSELIITINGNSNVWKEQQANAEKKLISNLEIKGFRKGKVPSDVAKKHISDGNVWEEAISNMLDIMIKESNKEIKDVLILSGPSYNIEKITKTEIEISFIYPIYPEVKLADYKSLGIKLDSVTVSKEDIDKELNQFTNRNNMLIKKIGPAAKGNIVNFDFEGFVDNKQFEGGKAEKYELELGSGSFIPGFEEQMIGLKAGDKKDVNVTFPSDYHVKELAGKLSIFKVLLHEVKEKQLSELNDDLVKEANIPNVKTVAEFKAYLKEIQFEGKTQQAKDKFKRQAFTKIKEGSDFVVNQQLISSEMQNVEKQFDETISKQGLDRKKYMELTNLKNEQLVSQFKKEAEEKVRDSIIFAELAKIEKIELTDSDYEKEYVKISKVYGQSVESIKGVINKQQIQIPLTNTKVIDRLIELNK